MKWDAMLYDQAKGPQTDAGFKLIRMAGVRPEDCILDIGCGTGKLTLELAARTASGTVRGIDTSEDMIAEARKSAVASTDFLCLSAENMIFEGEFDLVFSNSAFHWMKNQNEVIRRAYMALRKHGRLAFQFPPRGFCREFVEYVKYAIGTLGLDSFFEGWEYPWHFITGEQFEAILGDAGFKDVRIDVDESAYVFKDTSEVIRWAAATGLRPFTSRLSEMDAERFRYAFAMAFEQNRTEKGIEVGFRRLYAFAVKP